jgi:hypothetical protein
MASSSSQQDIPELTSNMQQGAPESTSQEASAYEIKGRTMELEEWDLRIQTENPVDFESLKYHGCDIKGYYEAQGLMPYFNMLNGPTYEALVRHFWVRALIYDKAASETEEKQKILLDPTLAGKSREEMGLEPYTGMEIRSSVLGMSVFIVEWQIASVLRLDASGKYSGVDIPDARNSPWNEKVNITMYNSKLPGKYADLSIEKKLLLKIQNENLNGGGSDQPSLGQKVFLHHFIKKEKVNVPKYLFKYMIDKLRKSQTEKRCWVPYGRLISEILHQGGILDLLSSVEAFSDELLDTKTGKFINVNTLKHMKLISTVTKLNSELSESRAKSDLMREFPPICKKDLIDVQIHFIKDYYETYNKVIRLEDVPEEMYGGALPLAQGRKYKRKETTKEEYLQAEQPAKKAKKGKVASDKLKIGGSAMPSIEEEVKDLDTDVVLNIKTRSGKAAASSNVIAPDQPSVPKKKRKPTLRKIKESPYVVEEVEGVEASTDLVIKEMNKKKAEDAAVEALHKALELSKKIEILASSIVREDAAVVAEEAIQTTEDLQHQVTSEAGNLMMIVSAAETESTEPEATSGNPVSPTNSVIDVGSSSPSSSQSSSSSSSTDSDDDKPLGQRYPKLIKSQPTTTKTYKKPSQTIPFEPMYPTINERIGEMSEMRNQICERLNLHHLFQPQVIQPLNMVAPDEVHVESSSSQPTKQRTQLS